jgi:hypothetical protein
MRGELMKLVHLLVGVVSVRTVPTHPKALSRHDERGLSQSTEIALLTGAVVLIVAVIVAAITAYVNAKLPRP